MGKKKFNKVVLAYSGGLDTSAIAKWLQLEYDSEVIAFTADLGQEDELEIARARAEQLGITKIYTEDLREEFVRDFVFPMLRANTLYEGEYLLGTAIARPLIAKRLTEIARQTGAEAVAHGATGKGNDQIRFELGVYALAPHLQVIAPWREWPYSSRGDLVKFCRSHGLDYQTGDSKERHYSIDANAFHTSYEGCELEDPATAPHAEMWRRTASPQEAPDRTTGIEIGFAKGDPVALNGRAMSPYALLEELNRLGGENAIGRLDLVENRFIGMKSRGCYETPGGAILLRAHRAMESLTLDGKTGHLKDELMPRYAEMIYNGHWWSPERVALQKMIDATQAAVEGSVRLELYKGNVTILGRSSDRSLYDPMMATFEDSRELYNQKDAGGLIRLTALRFLMKQKKKQ